MNPVAEDRRSQRPSRGGAAGAGRPSGPRRAGSSGGGRSAQSSERSQRFDPSAERKAPRGGSSGGGGGGDRAGPQERLEAPRGEPGAPDRRPGRVRRPDLPDEITGNELDRSITNQLKGLPEKLAARVARHLAAAGAILEEDPETAYRHTQAARARAPRLAVVREAAGEAAYAAGHYAEALAELRAAKRMNGVTAYLPMMADCHRALGQPAQALKLAKSPSVANFAPAAKAEMTIVEAGARNDLGQVDAALRTLELAPLSSNSREVWVVRLRYAYADILAGAGRDNDALTWFHRTYAIDNEQVTDAGERAEALERKMEGR